MLGERLAAGIAADRPHIIGRDGADRRELVGRWKGWAGHNCPIRSIPVLNELLRGRTIAIGTHGPYVIRRDGCYSKEVVIWRAGVGTRDNRLCWAGG